MLNSTLDNPTTFQALPDDETQTQPALPMEECHHAAYFHPNTIGIGAVLGTLGMFAAYGLIVAILVDNTRHPVRTEPTAIPITAPVIATPVTNTPVTTTPTPLASVAIVPAVDLPATIARPPVAPPVQAPDPAKAMVPALKPIAKVDPHKADAQKLLAQVQAFNAGYESNDSYRQMLTERAAHYADTKAGAEASEYLRLLDTTITNARKQRQQEQEPLPAVNEPPVQFGMRSMDDTQ